MILSALLGLQLRPKLSCWLKQSRSIRPSIKMSKDMFQLSIDVRQFNKNEIRVKARPEYVIIEGKLEKKTKTGHVMRQFVRRFKLPQGCNPESMESKLSPDGILTITAPRKYCDHELPCETLIPISQSPQQKVEDKFIDVNLKPNPCAKFEKDQKKSDPDKPGSDDKKT